MSTDPQLAPEDFDVALRAGVAQLLAAAGVGVWSASEALPEDAAALVDGDLPASPTTAVAISSYNVSDDPSLSDSVIGVQVTTRAGTTHDPRPTSRLSAQVYDVLHGMTNVRLPGGVYVVQCYRQSWSPTGRDEANRWRESSNFYVTVHRPTRNRT